MAEYLDCPLAIIEKRRIDNADRSETLNVIGDVEGKVALTFDDEILTGGTTINAGQALMECGVTQVYACATHPVFASRAYDAINGSDYEEVVVTGYAAPGPQQEPEKGQGTVGSPPPGRSHQPNPRGAVGGRTVQHPQLPGVSQPAGVTKVHLVVFRAIDRGARRPQRVGCPVVLTGWGLVVIPAQAGISPSKGRGSCPRGIDGLGG